MLHEEYIKHKEKDFSLLTCKNKLIIINIIKYKKVDK